MGRLTLPLGGQTEAWASGPHPPPLAVSALTHVYRSGRTALAGLDLEVEPGERVAVLGPNGSGKTTLLGVLAGLVRPTGGDARVLGHDPASRDPSFRRRLAVALDRPAPWTTLTGRENALLIARARGLGPAEARERVDRLLARFQLEDAADTAVADYSLGMKRRLHLAEALTGDPEVILLDEPTLGLDPAGAQALAGELAERAGRGAAALLATNDVAGAPGLARRIVFLEGGRVVADGEPEALLATLGGRTRIQVTLDPAGARASQVLSWLVPPEGVSARGEDLTLLAESERGSEPLPELIEGLQRAGARVLALRVREPDLGDVFRKLTGRKLDAREGGP